MPDSVRRAALAIEAFHKASLVHDDIEDDDTFRYGQETLHRQYGVGTAINVGDYLLGLGYRLISRERKELGGDCTADILDRLADAHLKLAEGPGGRAALARCRGQDADAAGRPEDLRPQDGAGFRGGPVRRRAPGRRMRSPTRKPSCEFSKNLGVAFQILNDLKDWEGDSDNKLVAGQDVLAGRPTLLLALALEGNRPGREGGALLEMLRRTEGEVCRRLSPQSLQVRSRVCERVREIFSRAGVFAKAEKLIEKYRARAEALADEIEPTPSCASCSITWSIACSTGSPLPSPSRRSRCCS